MKEEIWSIDRVKKKFILNGSGNTICFSLVCWTDGMWSIKIIDSWQKWQKNGVAEYSYKHSSPEQAIRGFLNYLEINDISPKELQEEGLGDAE